MKIQIRKGVFETNSSSMHSLCIVKTNNSVATFSDSYKLDENGYWILDPYDIWFGRYPFDVLHNIDTKARYVIASLWAENEHNISGFLDKITNILHCVDNTFKGIKWSENYDIKYVCGHVDDDILSKFLSTHKIRVKDFILNPKYVVIVDGDEYNIFKGLLKSGAIDKSVLVNCEEVESRLI